MNDENDSTKNDENDPTKFDDDAHGLWDTRGKEAAKKYWKNKHGLNCLRIDKMRNLEELRHFMPLIPWQSCNLAKLDFEIDMVLLDKDGEGCLLVETEVRASWYDPSKCPFIEKFYILKRKGKYLNRYPYPVLFMTFNRPRNIVLMVEEEDMPKEAVLMTHDKPNRPGEEFGYLIPEEKIKTEYGNWNADIPEFPDFIEQIKTRKISDPRIRF